MEYVHNKIPFWANGDDIGNRCGNSDDNDNGNGNGNDDSNGIGIGDGNGNCNVHNTESI